MTSKPVPTAMTNPCPHENFSATVKVARSAMKKFSPMTQEKCDG